MAEDAFDHLLAVSRHSGRQLDFVRNKIATLTNENESLKNRVKELERQLIIIQTAQSWALDTAGSSDSPWTVEQAQKIKEITVLLEKAHEAQLFVARADKIAQSGGKEREKAILHQLQREKKNCRIMRDRLQRAFHAGQQIKEENKKLLT